MLPACCIALTIFILLNSGKPCHKHVLMPAILGQASEVPFKAPIVPLDDSTTAFTPTDATSGFICPSEEGPKLEKFPTAPAALTAPTATALSASAGVLRKCHVLPPSFPLAINTSNPFLAARSAAMAAIVVLPFISA